ncbi:MAG: glycosyltransferase [Alphaproteobacteria bacterium]|nr:MAG: glycosyltransferase [Alphaproteobacteria bacterium]
MIMHVITNFTASAGAETMLTRLLRISESHQIIVVSLMGISARNRDLANNPRVTYVELEAGSPAALPGAIFKLAKLIRHERPKAVLCWMYHAMIAGTVAVGLSRVDTPVFWNVRQSLDDPASLSRSSRIAIAVSRQLSRRAAGFIYNSSRALEMHGAYGFSNHNAVVIPNGFDLPPLVETPLSAQKRIGIAARFHPQKDHATFFQAAGLVSQTHPDVIFKAAGHGLSWDNPAVARLIADAALPPERIELQGEIADMAGFYHGIDILALSSRTEGFPNVIAEAMSFAKPVVTTNVGDAAIVVGDGGIAVPARDPQALAQALRTLLDTDRDAYAQYALNARKRIERKYTLSAIETKYLDFLNKV